MQTVKSTRSKAHPTRLWGGGIPRRGRNLCPATGLDSRLRGNDERAAGCRPYGQPKILAI